MSTTDPVASRTPTTGKPASEPKRRGCFGLAFKSVLGCSAFAFGVVVALLLLLPTLCAGLVRRATEAAFETACQGSLSIGDLELSWWSDQEVRDAVLHDPDGKEVARVSAVVPSLLDLLKRNGPMRVSVTLEGDLVADDAGVTNLQRAIARDPEIQSDEESKSKTSAEGDPIAELARLDLEAVLEIRRLTWSDAETRRTGKPFELRATKATLHVRPGEPITLQMAGEVVSDVPGALAVDATVHGPIEVGKAWPLGKVDANVRIEGFSTPMVDGVAGLGGQLTEVVGPRFDLRLGIAGATPEEGDLDLEFASEHTNLAFAGRFEEGFLRSRDGAPLRLELGVPRGFVGAKLAPMLPPDVRVAWEESEQPWRLVLDHLDLPMPDLGAMDAAGMARTLEKLAVDLDLLLPSRVTLESEGLDTGGRAVGVEGITAKVGIRPGEAVKAEVRAKLLGTEGEGLSVVAEARDPWPALAGGPLPSTEVSLKLDRMPIAVADAVLGQGGTLVEGIGRECTVELSASARGLEDGSFALSVVSGNAGDERVVVRARGVLADQVVECRGGDSITADLRIPPDWIVARAAPSLPEGMQLAVEPGPIEVRLTDLAVPLADPTGSGLALALSLKAPGASVDDEAMRAAGTRLSMRNLDVSVMLQPGDQPLRVNLRSGFEPGGEGGLTAQVDVHEARAFLATAPAAIPRIDASVTVTGIPTRAIEALADLNGKLPEGARFTFPKVLGLRATGVTLPAPGAPMLDGLTGTVELTFDSIAYEDASTKAAGLRPVVRDFGLTVGVEPAKPVSLKLGATVETGRGEPGRLAGDLQLADPLADATVNGSIELTGFPSAPLDAFSGRPGMLSGLLGPMVNVKATAQGASPQAGSFRVDVTSDNATVRVAAALEDSAIVSASQPLVDASLALTPAFLEGQLTPMLPAGARLSIPEGSGPIQLTVTEARIPLPKPAAPTAEPAAESAPGPAAAALPPIAARIALTAPTLVYSDPSLAAAGTSATLEGFRFAADVAPGKLPSASLELGIRAEPPGQVRADLRALDPPELLSEENGLERFRVAADLQAKSVPTGLVDALAAQDGLLVDILGPTLDVALHTDGVSMAEGTFTASLESPQAKVTCDRGGLKERVIYLEKVEGKNEAVLARAGLTPLFSERVIGNIVPTLVNLQKPAGADPVSLSVEELRLPLDADLSKLDAIVNLDLGEVTYKLLPGIEGLLGSSDGKAVKVPPIRVPIQKGVASYDGLPIRVGGKEYALHGTFSLVDKSFRMETELPLSVLGKKVNDKLDSLRGYLDPNTMVPLELRGTWKSPKVRVGDDFLKKVAEDALKKQGGNLLEGLLKKKKD